MRYASEYLNNLLGVLREIGEKEADGIEHAAMMVADALQGGGMLYLFGTGHSHMLALEMFYRAGGPVDVCPILEESLMLHNGARKSSDVERIEGLARVILEHTPMRSGDVLIIASNSGRNAVPVEMAMCAREMGVGVIALTSLAHTTQVAPRNSAGVNLYQVADVVLDNHGVLGDASLDIPGIGSPICPTSTAAGVAILQMLSAEVAGELLRRGVPPRYFVSANIDGGEEHNEQLIRDMLPRVKPL
ncbi:MAG: SIS domain-containing protein [Anaerolineae bacterium]